MKIKNSQIVSFINGTMKLSEKRLPTKLGYAITKNLGAMKNISEAYEQERIKIVDKFAEKDAEGKFLVESESYVIHDMEGYGHEITELFEIENELTLHTVGFEELEKCDSEKYDALSVQDIQVLEIMME